MYTPEPPPLNTEDLASYIYRELTRIADSLDVFEVEDIQLQVQQTTLSKPRQGMCAYSAAGVLGANEGLYRYNGTSWVFIG